MKRTFLATVENPLAANSKHYLRVLNESPRNPGRKAYIRDQDAQCLPSDSNLKCP